EASAKTDTEIEIEGDNSGNQDNPPGAGSQGNQGDSSNTGNQGNPPGAGSQGNPGNQDNPPGAGSQGNQGDSSHTGNQGNPPGAGSQGSQNGAPAAGNQGNAPENTKVSQPDVKGEIPSTGDSVRLWILCAITLIAAVGMLALYGKSRRPRSRRYAGA
ncbi:MAG: hypothetical protein FWD27_08560, partial [Coriobacteriia bacterium]|nr:hypothetical protein [Coriobacteriia bacterium]